MAYRQTQDELRTHLREQLVFLRTSATAFDAGDAREAKRLAVIARILLHDTRNSTSLLTSLGVKTQLKFLDTAGILPPNSHGPVPGGTPGQMQATRVVGNLLAPLGIEVGRSANSIGHKAKLGDHGRDLMPKRFDHWWTVDVAGDPPGHRFSRRTIVLGLANQDGGAHVDLILRADWAAVTRQESMGTRFIGDLELPAENPIPEMMRQIAYEIDTTLTEQLRDLLEDGA